VERTRIALRVAPGARKPGVVGRYGDGWKIRVAEPPEQGRANDATLRLLAQALDVPRSRVRVSAGASSRDKIVEIDGVAAVLVDEKLRTAAGCV
jgi:uncharacterized protein YggU (UPF0235/DUF167 family)